MSATTAKSTFWSLTINNPCDLDEENINLARQKRWRVEGQKEKGANGTEHYQLLLHTPSVRFSAVKKAFPRAHIEIAKNVFALSQYVKKAETRIDSLKKESDKYPSLSKFWDLVSIELFNPKLNPLGLPASLRGKDILLHAFDIACSILIRKGYFIESMASNPQVRSSFSKYGFSILERSAKNIVLGQGQDNSSKNIPDISINALGQEAKCESQEACYEEQAEVCCSFS